MTGKIIVLEGIDTSGKDILSKILEERLIKENKKCIRFEFPMYDSPTGKIISDSYLNKNGVGEPIFPEGEKNVDPHVICLYYAADRKYNMPKINEYLDKGYYVILDRYVTSNLAHQGSKIRDKDDRFEMYQWIDKLEYWLLKLPKPDKTIFLKTKYDDLSLKNIEESYVELSELYNWDNIDCINKNFNEIGEEIYNLVINM